MDIDDNDKTNVTKEKILNPVVNGISLGAVSWEILNNKLIKMKFYDSYELSNIKSIKGSIYDTNGRILKKIPLIEDVEIVDQTAVLGDSHKSITIDPKYTFELQKSYMIAIKFYDANGQELAAFEPESPVTNN